VSGLARPAPRPISSADDPDWDILRRVAAGEVEAFSGLVERHQDRIVAVCRRMLDEPEEARDAAQEVFLRAFRTAASYRPHGQVFTWLYRIAVNYCLNRLRRKRLARFVPFASSGTRAVDADGADPSAAREPPDERPDAAAAVLSRERWLTLRRAIGRLPAGQRAVLVLAKFEGLSYREIARVLAITEGAVESRLVRAMRALGAADGAGRLEMRGSKERIRT
jgi:RNA polymerase sigma-70 factor (ECF subfamily)